MAGGRRALLAAVLLLLLSSTVTAAGRTHSATPTPSTSTSAPPPASVPSTSSSPVLRAGHLGHKLRGLLLQPLRMEDPGIRRTAPPAPGSSTSLPPPSAVSARLLGCDPMKVANALFTHCRDAPRPEPIPNARCCGAAVSTVARPTCFCLVQKEAAFVLSSVYNRSSMGRLLDSCGALPGLRHIVDDPCGDTAHTMDDHGCAVPVKASALCVPYKIATIVGWTLVGVLAAGVLYTLLWRQAPARRARR